jgi:hypothetical protein
MTDFPWEMPELLGEWDIPVEGEIYASEEVRLEIVNDGDIARSSAGFIWVHVTRAGVTVRNCFRTLEAAEAATRERARLFGAEARP